MENFIFCAVVVDWEEYKMDGVKKYHLEIASENAPTNCQKCKIFQEKISSLKWSVKKIKSISVVT